MGIARHPSCINKLLPCSNPVYFMTNLRAPTVSDFVSKKWKYRRAKRLPEDASTYKLPIENKNKAYL